MSQKKVSRRQALGTIGKTGLTLSTAPVFFLSLNTTPHPKGFHKPSPAGVHEGRSRNHASAPDIAEKVIISGAGSKLTVTISGPAGRYCAVAYATSDERSSYKPITKGRNKIAKDGSCIIDIDYASLPRQKIFLRVVTAGSADFTSEVRGTQSFQVELPEGKPVRFAGIRQRPLENAAAVASFAAACYAARGR